MSGSPNVIANAIATIEKQFGKGAVMSLSDYKKNNQVDVISTGALTLDIALGIMGIPLGRIVEIYGPESSGKTTLAMHIAANAQKKYNGLVVYIDAEHAFDPTYAASIGIDIDRLLISQPSCGEEALNIAEVLGQSGEVSVIVVDSVAALVPKTELDGEIGDAFVGLQARMMSQALRKLSATLSKHKTSAIFINQIREKISTGMPSFGNNETTTGGRALKFYASIRMDIRRIGSLKASDGKEFGNRTKVKVVKNKLAAPFAIAEFDILFGSGISNEGCIIDLALKSNIIDKKGAWFYFNKEQIGQGKESVRSFLKANPELREEITKTLLTDTSPEPEFVASCE